MSGGGFLQRFQYSRFGCFGCRRSLAWPEFSALCDYRSRSDLFRREVSFFAPAEARRRLSKGFIKPAFSLRTSLII